MAIVRMKDLMYKEEYVKIKVGLFRWNKKFDRAQEWLGKAIMEKMEPVMPRKTGDFIRRVKAENDGAYGSGKVRVSVPPQGRYLYGGISRSGKPFHWTNPKTEPYWGKFVIREYKHELKQGVEDILKGRK